MTDLSQARKLIEECKDTKNTYLDLRNCEITDLNELPDLFKCEHLETLILGDEREWNYEGRYENNRSCNYSENNKIYSIPQNISVFKKLTKLNMGGSYSYPRKLLDVSFLSSLTGLQYLNLENNQISDISFLSNLTCLQYLNLSANQISDISFLSNLTGLHYLNLGLNKISDISFLSNLIGLQNLNLGYNRITNYNFLSNITSLKDLNLVVNNISDIIFLSGLTELQSLNLSANQISDISILSNLTRLQNLNLGSNQISDISVLSNLTRLQNLNLGSNQISDISVLSNLTRLQNLNLGNNLIKKVPKFIFQLNKKVNMDEQEFSGIRLNNNPIEVPPLEIYHQGIQSVLDWFEAEKKKLNEIKIIFIGEPKAGKTSLLKILKYNEFNENEVQTDGVNIEDIIFGECDTFEKQVSLHDITGHIWDFGGQEIMNATHQFFLTKRSIYVLVLDARLDKNNTTQIRDWVKRIRATGGESPIIVVANQIDVNSSFGFVNERELQEEFPQIKYFIKVSCKTDINIDILKEKLAELIPTAELFHIEIDEKWITIKNKLQEETKQHYYLSEHRFIEICNEAKLTEEHKRHNVINFLHDLGLVLHFDDLKLAEYYVLDPYWITYGAYQILTSKYSGDEKGIVGMNRLEYIINEEEEKKESYQPANYKKINYSPNERRFLIDILNQFKLCFCVPDGSKFIIPDILDTLEPLNITDQIRLSKENVQFVYEYDYLPNSIMPNIMVETNNIIKEMWRTGCVLNWNGCEALITNYLNRISIIVTGEHKKKREFMSVIMFIIDSINQKLSNKIVRLIPLPGIKDGFVEYEKLITREKKGKTDYIHDEDKSTERSFKLSTLLDGIPKEEEVIFTGRQVEKIISKFDRQINEIKNKLDYNFEYLIFITNNIITKCDIQEAIKEINIQQTSEIINEIAKFFELSNEVINDKLDEKLKDIYTELSQTEDIQAKLSLSIPFINMLGINFDVEFDVKNWAKKMYEKYNLMIFKLMGAL
jgi:small GTP-binding protein